MIIYKVEGGAHQSCSLPINTIETTSPHHSKIGGALISNIINQQQQKRIKKSSRLTKDSKLFLQSLGFRLL